MSLIVSNDDMPAVNLLCLRALEEASRAAAKGADLDDLWEMLDGVPLHVGAVINLRNAEDDRAAFVAAIERSLAYEREQHQHRALGKLLSWVANMSAPADGAEGDR